MRKMFFRPSVSPAFPMSDKFNFFQNECFTFGLGIGCNQIIRRLLIAEGLRYCATCLLTEQLGQLSAMLPHEFGTKHIHPVANLLGTLMQSSNTVLQFTLPSVFAEIVNLGAVTLEAVVCGAVLSCIWL